LAVLRKGYWHKSCAFFSPITREELQAFAKAYVEVQKIKESHQGSLKSAQDPEQVQKLQQKTNAEMTKAMEKQGFTPAAYTQMLATINSDNTLNKKALDLVQRETRHVNAGQFASQAEVEQRLLTSIECPNYEIVGAGQSAEPRAEAL
jgi:Domain of unknown function (DUF4168)